MFTRFWERSKDFILLGVLLLLSLAVLLSEHNPLYRAARGVALEVTAPVDGAFARSTRFTRALQENDRLRDETVQLSAEVARLRAARRENERLRAMVGFRDTTDAPMVPARVVNKDIARQDNLLTVNVGRNDSIRWGCRCSTSAGSWGKWSS